MSSTRRDLFVCPGCRGDLEQGTDSLRCAACRRRFPIVRGIPRFVEDELYTRSFGFEWNRWKRVQLDSAIGRPYSGPYSETLFREYTGLGPEDLSDKLVLDAGVGAGRYAEVALKYGAEVVGVDLSGAVETARENLPHEQFHVAQADINGLPFRHATFDVIFSIGVLHHTPDERQSLLNLVPYLKPGGILAIWVAHMVMRYANFGGELLRRLTRRLPIGCSYALGAFAIPLYAVHRVPILGWLTHGFFPSCRETDWRERWLNGYDYLSPRYFWLTTTENVWRWMLEAGLADIGPGVHAISMRGRKPS